MQRHIVKSYDGDLKRLKEELMLMGNLVHMQWGQAGQVLKDKDLSCATAIVQNDTDVDQLEKKIDQLVLEILALRQPVALDLRTVLAALKASSDFERIGDYAANIARRMVVLVTQQTREKIKIPFALLSMMQMVHSMIQLVLQGFLKQDSSVLEKTWGKDLTVDNLYTALLKELLVHMTEDPHQIEGCVHLLFISKNIERAGDHITNIAEALYMMIKGKPFPTTRPHPEGFY